MKRYYILLSVIVLSLMLNSSLHATGKGSFDKPNFNFPKTVIQNAETKLQQALKNGNGEETVSAIIQSSLAKSMISSDSLPQIIYSIDKIAYTENADEIKSILYLLEAQIVNSYYNKFQYKISQRDNGTNSTTRLNEMFEWDISQFKVYISSLIEKSINFSKSLKSHAITEYPDIININKISTGTYPTLFDFVSYQCIDIYKSWGIVNGWNPFVRTHSYEPNDYAQRICSIYESLIKFHQYGSKPYIEATLNNLEYTNTNTEKKLDSLYQEFNKTPDVAPIVLALSKKKAKKKEQYSLLSAYLKKFPNSIYAPEVRANILSMEKPNGYISFKKQYTSTDSIEMICKVENISHFSIDIYNIEESEIRKAPDFNSMRPIFSKEISNNLKVPFCDTIRISVPPLPYGSYTATISIHGKNGKKVLGTNRYLDNFIVSDITSFSIFNNSRKRRHIFAVNAITGKPYRNITVTSSTNGNKPLYYSKKTNHNGSVAAYDTQFKKFKFTHGKDKFYSTNIYNNYYSSFSDEWDYKASIFTDLAIYRPAETAHISAVVYRTSATKKEPLKQHKVKMLVIFDASQDTVSSTELTTDNHGRIIHDYTIPVNRMNGEYLICIIPDSARNSVCGYTTITVSEYKTPTFQIIFDDNQHTFSDNSEFTIKGSAKTFSDMPLGKIPVRFSLECASLWNSFSKIASYETTTDENGIFSISIDAKVLKEQENSPFCTYRLSTTATDKVGESQSGSFNFTLGSSFIMRWNSNELVIDASRKVTLPVVIESNDKSKTTDFNCILSLKNNTSNQTDTLEFLSSKPEVDFSRIPSGEYTLSISTLNDTSLNIKNKKIIVFRPTEKSSPVNKPLWTPYEQMECRPGNNAEILLWNSNSSSNVYYSISYKDEVLKEGWISIPRGLTKFNYTMPQNAEANLIVQFYCVKDLVPYQHNITIKPKHERANMDLSIESFRDKITAGDREKWTLHLSRNGKSVANGAIISTMTDMAVNKLRNNRWRFSAQYSPQYTSAALSIQDLYKWGMQSNYFNWETEIDSIIAMLNKHPHIIKPEFNFYNQFFFASSMRRFSRSNNHIEYAAVKSNANETFATEEAVVIESAFGTMSDKMAADKGEDLTEISVRTAPVKTVFWKPMLVTDENGNAGIEFIVPNYNTTWMFQAVGYDKDLNTATLLKEIVSNKPIMVKSNMPRFLRQGDRATLMASVQNATDSIQSCHATIEIFNPVNNDILKTQDYNFNIFPQGTEITSIEYTVPDSLTLIAFRIKATNGTHSDGEQVAIPILLSTSLVTESKSFYIDAGEESATIKLPKFPKNADVTLEYCDNPVWYIATALPSIQSNDNTTATQLAHSIFTNIIARKVANENPQILEALKYWRNNPQDSALISMLEKNPELKIGDLIASPFLQASKEQTLRMSQLSQLFDNSISDTETSKLILKLKELQLEDGGFSWFKYPGATSSPITTLNIMQVIGKAMSLTRETNTDLTNVIKNSVSYLDKAIIEKYNRQDDRLSYSGFLNYAYTRSLYMDIPMSTTVNNLYEKILESLTNEWERMDIPNKAFTAITLANFGRAEQAKPIIESLGQYSIYKPHYGRFWDTFSSGRDNYIYKTSITSLILQAYHKIKPASIYIDQIREWLIIEKQANDWGNSSMAADAVYAILSTGSDYLAKSQSPSILINGKKLEFKSFDKILGYGKMKLNINNQSRNNTISIDRTASSPAWGAIYSKYYAHMKDIKAASCSALSIKKEISNISSQSDTFKVGDKVRVTLIITNSRDLEFVTLTDDRPACIEPSDQISGYRVQDLLGYYMEVKDSATNLFFYSLPKGTHVITYDAYVTNPGKFNCGIATIQCQYAPQIVAHSAGSNFNVK